MLRFSRGLPLAIAIPIEELAREAELIAQYEKVVSFKSRFVMGAEGERIIADLANVQPAMIDFFRKYVETGQ